MVSARVVCQQNLLNLFWFRQKIKLFPLADCPITILSSKANAIFSVAWKKWYFSGDPPKQLASNNRLRTSLAVMFRGPPWEDTSFRISLKPLKEIALTNRITSLSSRIVVFLDRTFLGTLSVVLCCLKHAIALYAFYMEHSQWFVISR